MQDDQADDAMCQRKQQHERKQRQAGQMKEAQDTNHDDRYCNVEEKNMF